MDQQFILECRNSLVSIKEDLMSQSFVFANKVKNFSSSGDQIDQANSLLEKNKSIHLQEKVKKRLIEVSVALEKINNNDFGICEYTGLEISKARLKALPWTRLSIEGAETIEQIRRKFKQPTPT